MVVSLSTNSELGLELELGLRMELELESFFRSSLDARFLRVWGGVRFRERRVFFGTWSGLGIIGALIGSYCKRSATCIAHKNNWDSAIVMKVSASSSSHFILIKFTASKHSFQPVRHNIDVIVVNFTTNEHNCLTILRKYKPFSLNLLHRNIFFYQFAQLATKYMLFSSNLLHGI